MTSTNSDLSEREREILRLVAIGASNKEVGRKLYISANTVKVHLRNIYGKIGVRSRTEAAMYAVNVGLVQRTTIGYEDDEEPDNLSVDDQTRAGSSVSQNLEDVKSRSSIFAFILPVGVLAFLLVFSFWVWSARNLGDNQLPNAPRENVQYWKAFAPMPTARYGLAAVAYDGFIYAVGGQTISGPTGAIERFDPVQNSWKQLAAKPTPVYEIHAAVVGGKIYVPGGKMSSDQVTDSLEIYDPQVDQWENGAPLPTKLSGYALATFEGFLYLFGGWDGEKFLSKAYKYDPKMDKWIEISSLPKPRGYSGAAVVGNKIFIIGGFDGKQSIKENLVYSPNLDDGDANPWGEITSLPVGRYGMAVSGIADIIEVVGGLPDTAQQPNSLSYFPLRNKWQEFCSIEERSPAFASSVTLENFLFLIGGLVESAPTSQNLACQAIYTVSFPIVR